MQFPFQIRRKSKTNLLVFGTHRAADFKAWEIKDQIERLDKAKPDMLNKAKHCVA